MEMTEATTDSSGQAKQAGAANHLRVVRHVSIRILKQIFTTPGGWWLICISVAAIVIWPLRDFIITDGLSYLDIASEASRGELTALGNTYWSPAYPALIGVDLFLFRPSPAWEVPLVQLTNFFIFILALGAFTVFYRLWSRSTAEYEQASSSDKGLFTLFAFASFLWFIYSAIPFPLTTPDMLVAAKVFFVAAMGYRVSRPDAGWKHFAGLGALLGAGIYAKAALFPLAIVFIAVLFFSLTRTSYDSRKRQLANLAVTSLMCVSVAAPLIVCMSLQAGRFTSGDAGKLNYLWHADGFEPSHLGWTGGTAPEYGSPLHAPRKLMENPTVLEFATPIAGTYPLWHSPGYWYAGAKPAFKPRKQIEAVRASLHEYKGFAMQSIAFIGGAILLLLLGMVRGKRGHRSRLSPWLLAWSLAGCAMYAVVSVEQRYVAAYLLLLCLEVYRVLIFRLERRLAIGVCAIVLLVAMAPVALNVASSLATTVRQFRHPADMGYVVVAKNLQHLGLQPGDKIAVVGYAANCYYARYDQLRVVAQIQHSDDFWRLNPADAKRVEDRLASIGVRAVIASNRPAGNQESGWIELGRYAGESHGALLLQPASLPAH
jgi:hypothetical protein